jgi:hypothetical protein
MIHDPAGAAPFQAAPEAEVKSGFSIFGRIEKNFLMIGIHPLVGDAVDENQGLKARIVAAAGEPEVKDPEDFFSLPFFGKLKISVEPEVAIPAAPEFPDGLFF